MDAVKHEILMTFMKFGMVEEIEIHQYRGFLDIIPESEIVFVPSNFENSFDPQAVAPEWIKEEGLDQIEYKQTKETKKLFNSSKKIIANLQNNKEKKLNKSFAFIKFKDMESKIKSIQPDTRVLGFHVFNNLCKLEDVDYKTSIVINNIAYGTPIEDLCEFVNNRLSICKGLWPNMCDR